MVPESFILEEEMVIVKNFDYVRDAVLRIRFSQPLSIVIIIR